MQCCIRKARKIQFKSYDQENLSILKQDETVQHYESPPLLNTEQREIDKQNEQKVQREFYRTPRQHLASSEIFEKLDTITLNTNVDVSIIEDCDNSLVMLDLM
ncbi:Hypothetical_protein [Hexamita inflata]|uniref:Hypothetical_protein n=1 Tax=Hexamita inflata TaxID=28002 RepID=A0AA86TT66_9EUKA|nr:Hypothetical protein HINF_LOCUS15075 [Hexamita inflata]